MNLIRAELFKIRTTSLWWVMAIVLLPLYAISMAINIAAANLPSGSDGGSTDASSQVQAAADPIGTAANLYTTGQYMGVLIVLLLSAIIVTSEFFHLTATSTFLVTPRREAVILAKFAAATVVSLVVWGATTLLNLAVAPIALGSLDLGSQLGEPAVWRAVGLNALAFALWAVLGVGVGVLIRSQIAATLVLAITYTVGTQAVTLVFFLLTEYVAKWFENLQILVPTNAAQLLVSGLELPGDPPRYLGGLILLGYAMVAGLIGTLLTKRRDVS